MQEKYYAAFVTYVIRLCLNNNIETNHVFEPDFEDIFHRLTCTLVQCRDHWLLREISQSRRWFLLSSPTLTVAIYSAATQQVTQPVEQLFLEE